MYPVHLRGTGEGFAANIGGRLIGTSAAWVTTTLALSMPGSTPPTRLAYAAVTVALATYLIGSIACFWLPEPQQEELPDSVLWGLAERRRFAFSTSAGDQDGNDPRTIALQVSLAPSCSRRAERHHGAANGWRWRRRSWVGCSTAWRWACFPWPPGACSQDLLGGERRRRALVRRDHRRLSGRRGDRRRAVRLARRPHRPRAGHDAQRPHLRHLQRACAASRTRRAELGVLRFIAALGMGGEWSLGVALVMEVWPNRSRAFMAGLIGAAANVGFLLIAVVGLGLTTFIDSAQSLIESTGMPQGWVDLRCSPIPRGGC